MTLTSHAIPLSSVSDLFDLPSSSPQIQSFLTSCRPRSRDLAPKPLPVPETASFPDGTFENYHTLGISLFLAEPAQTKSSSEPRKSSPIQAGVTSQSRGLERIDLYNPPPPPPPTAVASSSSTTTSTSTGPNRLGRPKRPRKTYSQAPNLILHFPSEDVPIPPRPEPIRPDVPRIRLRSPSAAPVPTSGQSGEDTTACGSSDPAQTQPTFLKRERTFIINPRTTATDLVKHLGEPTRKGGDKGGWVGPWLEWSSVELVRDGEDGGHMPEDGTKAETELQTGPKEDVDNGSPQNEETTAKSASGARESALGQGGQVVRIGIMVELAPMQPGHKPAATKKPGEEEKPKGLGVWDQVGDWTWGVIKVFKAGSEAR